MDAHKTVDVLLFEGFCRDRCGGGLFRLREGGAFEPLIIGSRALELLDVLVDRRGEVVDKSELMEAVWPGRVVEENNLAVQISTLRRLLDHGRPDGSCIQTVPGRGYRFVAAVTQRPQERASDATQNGQSSAATGAIPTDGKMRAPMGKRGRLWRNGITNLGVLRNRWFGSNGTAPRMSIVVLPFANLSDDRDQQFFADGITEDLTTDLSRLAHSLVISRNTAFTYRNKIVDAKRISRELGVRYVLEGSVRRSGNQVRVNAQLIDAETDSHLWADRFEGDTNDLFALQDEITARIGNALNVELVLAEAARRTANLDTLDYIFRGRAAFAKGPGSENLAEAISYFERALALEQRSVEAQGRLANALMSRVLEDMTNSVAADIARAEGLIGQVLTASPNDPRAHFTKGQLLRHQQRIGEALREYEMAIALDRNLAVAFVNLGRCRMLTGLLDEAITPMERAIRLSPRDPFISTWYSSIGSVHLLQSRADEAILWFEKSRSANPRRPYVHIWLASAYALKGESGGPAAALAEARRLSAGKRYSSIAHLQAVGSWGVPKVRALFEATFFAGLRKAGMPEE